MNKTPSHTGSTLRLKILAIYIIFGFLAIFTTSILVSGYALDKLTDYTASRLYKSANVTASQYLPKYFNETISLSEVRTQLSGIESYTDAAVWLVDAEGNLKMCIRDSCIHSISKCSVALLHTCLITSAVCKCHFYSDVYKRQWQSQKAVLR